MSIPEHLAQPPIQTAFVCFSIAILIAIGLGLTGRKGER
jgi:hypothetical protein